MLDRFKTATKTDWASILGKLNAMVDAINLMITLHNEREMDQDVSHPSFFPVLLEEDGGAAGDATTACSFTYTLKWQDGTVIVAAQSPVWRPQTPGTLLSGDGKIGMAYYDDQGTLTLYSASETIDASTC